MLFYFKSLIVYTKVKKYLISYYNREVTIIIILGILHCKNIFYYLPHKYTNVFAV